MVRDPVKREQRAFTEMATDQTVVGVFESIEQAQAAAGALHEMGYSDKDIAVKVTEPGAPPSISASQTRSGKTAWMGFAAGLVVGGILGWAALFYGGIDNIVGNGTLSIVLSIFFGAVIGGILGALLGSFVGLNQKTPEGQAYEESIREGAAIVEVNAPNEDIAERITEALKQRQAREVSNYARAL